LCPVLIAATAIFGRTGHKYRDRTYRYVLADLGHALENLRVVAGAAGAPARLLAAFDEAQAAQALGVDEREEGVLAMIALAAPPASPAAPSPWMAPSADAPAALGVTAAVHAATSLRAAAPPVPASAALPSPASPPQESIDLPAAAPSTPDWRRVIATRRSVRRYAATPLPLQALADVLAHMTTRHGKLLSAAVRVNVVAHAVAGLAPGAYRYEAGSHGLVPVRVPLALRSAARAAALDQDVIGDAAAVFVLSIERAAFAADPLGAARGYRHAFLEAGLVGERVYLEGVAQGLGACAVGAFYDDEAAALVGVDPQREWVVHFAALGVKG
jgi:SagB-type dehydrogenase family enzyme